MSGTEVATTEKPTRKLPVPALASLVVGSMVGAGVFSLPAQFAESTGIVGAAIAWTVAGLGMLTLVFIFQRLVIRKPHLDAGIYAYAKAGFGDYVGFFSAFGYWASACAGNATYCILICSTLGAVFPAFGTGNTIFAIGLSTVGVWVFFAIIARGIRQAAILNTIVTIAKLLPLLFFLIVVALIGVNWDTFSANLWGGGPFDLATIPEQVRSTMLLTVFVFLGVEGATAYSRYAHRRKDVGRATLLGFLSVLALFVLVSILSFGVLPREDLAELQQPSVAGVLEAVVGPWGYGVISVGLIVSVLGAYLAWTLLSAQVLYTAAKNEDAPRFLTAVNARGVPVATVIFTSVLVQVLLIVSLFSENAFDLMLKLCSSLVLIPYFLTASYALKLETKLGDDAAGRSRRGLILAILATAYTLFLVIAAGPQYVLLSFIIYACGTVLYVMARRERNLRVFTPAEWILCVGSIALAALAIGFLATGIITI